MKILGLSGRNWKCFFAGLILAWISGCAALWTYGGVPVKFTVETSRADMFEHSCYHGETLDFEVTYKSYGKDLYIPTNYEAQIFWQTNGMSAFFWRTNTVTCISNKMYTTFLPSMDPGTSTVYGFIGVPEQLYRAAFVLRFKNSPGAKPKEMEWPYRELDFNQVQVKHAPYYLKSEVNTILEDYVPKTTKINGKAIGNGLTLQPEDVDAVRSRIEYVSSQHETFVWKLEVNRHHGMVLKQDVIETWGGRATTNTYDCFKFGDNKAYSIGDKTIGWRSSDDIGFFISGDTSQFDSYKWETGYQNWYITKNANGVYYELHLPDKPANAWRDKLVTERILQSGMFTNEGAVAYGNATFLKKSEAPSTNGFIKVESDPTVPSWAKQPNPPSVVAPVESVNGKTGEVELVASDVGAYSATSGNTLAQQVATQGAHLNAEDAQFVSTNYDSQINLPEAYVRIKLQQGGTNVWQTIWEEMRRWNTFTGVGFNWRTWGGFHQWSTNLLAMIDETSPKEYAFYDGVTGEVAPDGFFWISQPKIAICAGAAYQRHLDAGGAVWILESNGLVANIGGTTNGYFRISDEEGNTQFEIIKGDKQTVPAIARSVRSQQVMGVTHWICDYAVTNALAAPTAKFCRSLSNPTWIADTEASCPCNVTWTPGVNTYTLEFWPKTTEPTMFCKSEYDRGGETRIRQAVPTEMQYIILNGTKYGLTPKTINGELVMGLTTGN